MPADNANSRSARTESGAKRTQGERPKREGSKRHSDNPHIRPHPLRTEEVQAAVQAEEARVAAAGNNGCNNRQENRYKTTMYNP